MTAVAGSPMLGRPGVAASRTAAVAAAGRSAQRERRGQVFRIAWFGALFSAICLEGLGRRYLRFIPLPVFYFMKDVLLVFGFFRFGIHPDVRRLARRFYGLAIAFFAAAVLWTLLEIFNPQEGSYVLALLGIRAYWLWWFAPLIIASALLDPVVRRGAIYMLAINAVIVCVFAVLQFGSPPEASINTYSLNLTGAEVQSVSVTGTGRVRVAGTFSFITGFSNFSLIVPSLLLTVGLGEPNKYARLTALGAAILSAAVLPMSGSRAPLLIGSCLLLIIAWSAGFLFTKVGRRVVVGIILIVGLSLAAFPDASLGVLERMGGEDTTGRIDETMSILPPVSLTKFDYPWMGIGVGMQLNVRGQLGVGSYGLNAEYEAAKHLIEVGVPGYLLFWLARAGIAVAMLKASFFLRRAKRGAAAGAAIGFAVLTFFGNLTFDHIWQALYFTAVTYILLETVLAYRTLKAVAQANADAQLARALAARTGPRWPRDRTVA